jgi:hypothetical protein
MRPALRCWAIVALVASSSATAAPLNVSIARADVDRAVGIARKTEAERQRFHDPYFVQLGSPSVVSMEVISEFRRVVLAAEDRERSGDRSFTAAQAEEVIRPWRGRISIIAHVKYSPLNRLISVPQYELTLAGARGTPDLRPVDIRSKPFFVDGAITAADIEAVFESTAIARTKRTIVLKGPQAQLAAAAFDFAAVQ